jgi:hypothetical protein
MWIPRRQEQTFCSISLRQFLRQHTRSGSGCWPKREALARAADRWSRRNVTLEQDWRQLHCLASSRQRFCGRRSGRGHSSARRRQTVEIRFRRSGGEHGVGRPLARARFGCSNFSNGLERRSRWPWARFGRGPRSPRRLDGLAHGRRNRLCLEGCRSFGTRGGDRRRRLILSFPATNLGAVCGPGRL